MSTVINLSSTSLVCLHTSLVLIVMFFFSSWAWFTAWLVLFCWYLQAMAVSLLVGNFGPQYNLVLHYLRWHSFLCYTSHHEAEVTKLMPRISVSCRALNGSLQNDAAFLVWTSLEGKYLERTKASKAYIFWRWLLMVKSCKESKRNKGLVLIPWTRLAWQAAWPPTPHSNEKGARWESSNCRRLYFHK